MSTPSRNATAGLQPPTAPSSMPPAQTAAGSFRASLDAEPLPSQVIPAPSPRGSRWGKGPLVEGPSLQLGAAPKQQRVRRPR